LGIAAQWLAWRLKFPSILFLLIFGFLIGPVTGFLHPDKLMGELLFPVVSISVALILFEGGLTLRISELREIGRTVLTLISAGVVVTWVIAAAAAHFILDLNLKLAILLGAILVVTGPTVVGPLLRHIRPLGKVGNILKWEGIVIDPVGALLAVLVFEAVLVGEIQEAGTLVFLVIVKTIFFGGLVGLLFAGLLVVLLRRFWIPDFLQETVTLMLVIAAFVISNLLQAESGLLAATLMGLAMDNQKQVSIKHIVEFKENLRVLIISSLFVLLAARLQISDFGHFSLGSVIFLGVLIFVARPVSVFISTLGSELRWRERLFISWLAPRGIVAAAIASVFAIRLTEIDLPQTEYLVPLTFMVIVGTVAVYGLTATPVARWLKVAQTHPQGVLIIGAHSWARAIAKALQGNKLNVVMVDTNWDNISKTRLEGIPSYHGSVLSEHILDEIELDGIGRLLALTPNDEANSLAALNFAEIFESPELYQLPPASEKKGEESRFSPKHLRGRLLFGQGIHYSYLADRFLTGWIVKSTKLSDEFGYDAFKRRYGEQAVPMFLMTEGRSLVVFTTDTTVEPKPGQTIIALVLDEEKSK
jgi:NhaP-type Na+/H+ or K+/H+ antiporter